MGRRFVLISAGAAVFVGVSYWLSPPVFREILLQPFATLSGTHRQLHSRLIEVSESAEPVAAAARRLLQPLGVVRLIRVFPVAPAGSPDGTPPADPPPSRPRAIGPGSSPG